MHGADIGSLASVRVKRVDRLLHQDDSFKAEDATRAVVWELDRPPVSPSYNYRLGASASSPTLPNLTRPSDGARVQPVAYR